MIMYMIMYDIVSVEVWSMANCCANVNVEALRLQHKSAHRQRFQRFPDNFRNLSDYMDYQVQYHPSLSLMGTLTCFPGFTRIFLDFPVCARVCHPLGNPAWAPGAAVNTTGTKFTKIYRRHSKTQSHTGKENKKINKVSTKKQGGM